MATVKESLEVDVPVSTAYNQWTQFEEFPLFMEGVESVQQLDDTRLQWVVNVNGERRDWVAEIAHQEPDSRIAWRAVDGKENAGTVTFEPLGPDRTRVTVELSYETEGLKETLGSAVGIDDRRVKGDLERFKELVESRGVETGAWRGRVREGEVTS
jgi:uncharacterized membrane protein